MMADGAGDRVLVDAIRSTLGDHEIVAVAFSGGRDSGALLHATLAAVGLSKRVIAVHVNHGLSPHADEWVGHCQREVERLRRELALSDHGSRLDVRRLVGGPAVGESVEAWAREGRYAALRSAAAEAGATCLLLGHHRRDQAETFLLQALRGAGLHGLASMPAAQQRDGIAWLRPWLHLPREAIEAYVARHRLPYIDDDSNDHRRYARNRLRLEAWPALTAAFDQAEKAFAASAGWMQQAGDALDELAVIDLAHVEGPANDIDVAALGRLSVARRSNVLRAWLTARLGKPASTHLVQRLIRQVEGSHPATWTLKGGYLRRYRGRLSHESLRTEPAGAAAGGGPARAQAAGEPPLAPLDGENAGWPGAGFDSLYKPLASRPPVVERLPFSGAGRVAASRWPGDIVFEPVTTGGVAPHRLGDLQLRDRVGGESFQLAVGRPARSLKKQYQALGIPAWHRDGPLLFAGGALLYVPGLGIDARFLAEDGEPQWSIAWLAC